MRRYVWVIEERVLETMEEVLVYNKGQRVSQDDPWILEELLGELKCVLKTILHQQEAPKESLEVFKVTERYLRFITKSLIPLG